MTVKCIVCVFTIGLFVVGQVFAATYNPWSENVFASINKEYGAQAEKRVRYLHAIILENQNKPVDEKLKLVNDTMKKFPG